MSVYRWAVSLALVPLFALVLSSFLPANALDYKCVRDSTPPNTTGVVCRLVVNDSGQFSTRDSCIENCNRLCARGFKPSCNFTSVCKVYGFAINFMSVGAGLVALVVLLYGAYRYVMGKGVAEEISKAQAILINAGIGLVLVVVAYSLTRLVLALLQVDTVCF